MMTAHIAGNPIQQKGRRDGEQWEASPRPAWNWEKYRYRVAPEAGYFCIRTETTLIDIKDTRLSAEKRRKELSHRYDGLFIVQLVEKPRDQST